MIKNFCKRSLSIFLCLILIATTFFIFDPSVLKVDADAYVNVESNNTGASMGAQEMHAPECIYLQPGSANFKEFLDFNSASGAATETSTSGTVSFTNPTATQVQLAVNKFYYKNGSTDVAVPTGKLKLNDTVVGAYANLTGTTATGLDTDFPNTPTILATGTTGVSVNITSGSLTDYVAGRQYYIQWAVRYQIDGEYHLAYMYTGIYAPTVNQAGASIANDDDQGNSDSKDEKNHAYTFITGAQAYAGGNRKSNFTGLTSGLRTAPLIAFIGRRGDNGTDNSALHTIPGGDSQWNSTDNFTVQNGGGVYVPTTGPNDRKVGRNVYYFSRYTSVGSVTNPTVSANKVRIEGTKNKYNDNNTSIGMSFIMVDTSRFTNYNQIPNLSIGWAQFYHQLDGNGNRLVEVREATIASDDAHGGDVSGGITATVNTGNHDNGNSESFVRGLYKLNGTVSSGTKYIRVHYLNGWKAALNAGTETSYIHVFLGFNVQTSNKAALRSVYAKALRSNIDLTYKNKASAISNINYADYYNRLKAAGENLVNQLGVGDTDTILDGYIESYQGIIKQACDSSVYFYVPEVIYINPTNKKMQYFVDRGNSDNSTLTNEHAKTSGNVYFHCANATNVTITNNLGSKGTMTVSQTTTQNGTINTTITAGTLNTYSNTSITWTATYTDKTTGKNLTATAYSYCYCGTLTGASSVVAATCNAGNTSGTEDFCIAATAWVTGCESVDAQNYQPTSASAGTTNSSGDGRGSYSSNWIQGQAVPKCTHKNLNNLSVSGTGWSGYYSTNGSYNYQDGGKGTLTVDSSRYENLGQIPYFDIGVDCNSTWDEKSYSKSTDLRLYYDWVTTKTSVSANDTGAYTSYGRDLQGHRRQFTATGATFAKGNTATKTLAVTGYGKSKRSDYNREARGTCYVVVSFHDKGVLRDAYDYMMQNSSALQQAYFKTAKWTTFTNARSNLVDRLMQPQNATAQSDYQTLANNLYNAVNAMVACVKADAGTTTAQYKHTDGTTKTINRSDYLNSGTVKVYHRVLNGETVSSATSPLNIALGANSTTNLETRTYFYGETVKTAYNETPGYSYVGYNKQYADTQWTSTSNGALTGNGSGSGLYGSSGHTEDTMITQANISVTYVYHKNVKTLYKNYGEGNIEDSSVLPNFEEVPNMVNLTGATFNTTWQAWGNRNAATNVNSALVTTTGFQFTINTCGYHNGQPDLFYNDIFITNATTANLVQGQKYTVSFASNLGADAIRYYINGGTLETDFEYKPGMVECYVGTSNGTSFDGTAYLDKVDLEFTQGGAIGSFTAAANTKAAILFRVITDGTNRFSGTISNVRVAKGDYVETGLYGDNVTLDTPTRTGYDFTGWAAGSPFTGTLSGTLNKTYTYGLNGGEVVANWLVRKYDIAFDNEYDFDNWANSITPKAYETRDLNANEVTLNGTQTSERPITNYGNSVNLVVGHTYRVVCDAYVANEACKPKVHIKNGSSDVYFGGNTIQPGNTTKISTTFVAAVPTVTLAYYVSNQNGSETTHNGIVTFGNLYIQDVTTPTGVVDGTSTNYVGTLVNGPNDSALGSPSYTTTSSETAALLGENVCDWDVSKFTSATNGTMTKDTATQTITLTSTAADCYTNPYSGSSALYCNVVGGHTYRFSYMCDNTSTTDARLRAMAFAFDEGSTSYSTGTNGYAVIYAETKGVHVFDWTVPASATRVAFRFGIYNKGATVKFSNLNIIDITEATTAPRSDNVKYHEHVYQGDLLTKAQPILTRPGFVFDGWCTGQDSTGNGTGEMANIDNVMQAQNKHLYAKWSCNVVYDENGGHYKDAQYSARNRSGIAPGTTIAVSNRIKQNDSNWNSTTSRSLFYVPYKVGYNFAGWKAYYEDGTSSSTNYWPQNTITVNQNIRFVAQWTAASTVSLDTQYAAGTKNNGNAHYPGQIWFYKFVPSTNMQVTAYTYNNGSNNRDPYMYFVTSGTATVGGGSDGKGYNNDYSSVSWKWGLDTSTYLASGSYNALTNNNLTAGTTYYYGFALNGASFNADSYNFKLSENKVVYTLDPNGGNSMSPNTYTGHYNTALSVPPATRTGYTFSGWKASSAPTSTYIGTNATSNASIPAADNTTRIDAVRNSLTAPCTLVAQWNINSYDLRVKAYYNTATNPTTAGTTYSNGNTGGTVAITSGQTGVALQSDSTDSSAHAKVEYQRQATFTATPKTGYYFKGFYTAPTINGSNQITAWGSAATNIGVAENDWTGTKEATSIAMSTSGLTYYARFDIRKFDLFARAYFNTANDVGTWTYGATGGTCKVDGGTASHNAGKQIYYQQRPTITATPATGYAFVGWYKGDNTTGTRTTWPAAASTSASYQVTAKAASGEYYWARFDIQSFTLYAYAYNNTSGNQNSWSNGVTGGNVAISAAQNGGSGLGTAGQGVNRLYYYNSTVSLKATPATGYNFVAWYTTNTAPNTSSPVTNWDSLTYYNASAETTKAMPNSNIYYLARFDIQKHNVNVYVQGNAATNGTASTTTWTRGVGGTVKVGSNAYNATSSTASICYGTYATIYAKPNTGYYFKGFYSGVTLSGTTVTAWNTARGETGSYTTEQSRTTDTMGISDLNYYARFDIRPFNLKVYAYYKGATSDTALQTNWANATTGGTVKIDNGAAGKDATLSVFYGQTATITATPATGYNFSGWYSSVTGGNGAAVTAWGTQFKDGSYANTAVTTEAVNQERVYYAKFDIQSNAVTLKAYSNTAAADTTFANNTTGGAVGYSTTPADATATRNVYYNQTTTIYAKPAAGYEFAGWYTNTTFTGTPAIATSACTNSGGVYSKQITNVTSAATYNAKFVIVGFDLRAYAKYNTASATNVYNEGTVGGTVAITANGNIVKVQTDSTTAIAHAKVYYGQTATMVATANTGYRFDGWYSDPALTSQHNSNASAASSAMTTAGLNYYAKFSVISYKATAYAYCNTADAVGTYTNSNVGGTVVAQGTTPSTTAGANAATSETNQYFGGIYTVRAYPATGYNFDGWYADAALTIPADGTCTTLTMSEAGGLYQDNYDYRRFTKRAVDEKVYAKFSIGKPQLTVYAYANTGANLNSYANGTTGGTVKINAGSYTTSINPTTGAATATANVYFNKTASITATAATGYTFGGWYTSVTGGNGSAITAWGTRASTQETMTTANMPVAGQKYYAKFDVDSFTIVLNPNGGANGSTSRVTAYYNTACNIGQSSVPTRTGFDFLGWSESNTAETPTWTYSNSTCTFSAANVNNWHSEVHRDGEKTLYAVWKAWTYNLTISTAYDMPTTPGSYTVGTTGGTATLDTATLNTGDIIWNHITVNPATGYEFDSWRFGSNATAVSNGAAISKTWGDYQGSNLLQMPAYSDGANIRIVVFFSVAKFKATAYAMSNNASATGTYTNNAAGGTVKYTQAGAPGATAEADVLWHTTATFYATPSTGYRFDGWFKDSALTVSDGTNDFVNVNVEDTRVSGQADANKRYAKFSILTYTAYGRAKYFTDGIDAASGSGINGINGGIVKVASETNTTGVTTTNADAVSLQALYTEEVTYTATPNSGYMFVGWYICENTDLNDEFGNEIETDISDGVKSFSFTMPEEDVRVHARFVPHNLFVVLNPNGGVSGALYQVTLTYNKAQEIGSDSLPTWTGHSFSGWAPTSSATSPTWTYTDGVCTFAQSDINSWYNEVGKNGEKTIYAVWIVASFEVLLNHMGGTGGQESVTVTVNQPMPTVRNLPTYAGYELRGYYSAYDSVTGEYNDADRYYSISNNGEAVSTKNWTTTDNGVLYAKWTCPILNDATYTENPGGGSGTWTYTFEKEGGGEISVSTDEPMTSAEDITEIAPEQAKEITSIAPTENNYIETKIEQTTDINLNHYNQETLSNLLDSVNKTNSASKLALLSQPEINAYIARISKDKELSLADNRKMNELNIPKVKIYETPNKLVDIKSETITRAADSANGSIYSYPQTTEAANYAFAGKWSTRAQDAVNYYLYTNSRNPVIAVEIDDGAVGTTVANNTASYPTKATVTDNYDASLVTTTAASDNKTYTESAVKATDDITQAWFYPYIAAGIGTNYDYNAKKVIYLTPTFTSTDVASKNSEIIYTITPTDDAYVTQGTNIVGNVGVNSSTNGLELAGTTQALESKYASYNSGNTGAQLGENASITICINYHNAMNGISEEGGVPGDPYLQMYPDQVNVDTWLNQMHLFRTAGGASNWEFPTTTESTYPIYDKTFADTGYVLGSFAYIFDSTNEPVATSYAASGDYEAAKNAIVHSVKMSPSEFQAAIPNKSHPMHFVKNGIGLFEITGWSSSFYPKRGAYVYAHLVDRWGNVFNKVWKCFNVDSYASTIKGSNTTGFTVFEDGGSNLSSFSLANVSNLSFVTDSNSSFEDGVFTTTGKSFKVSTGVPNKSYTLTVMDKASNKTTANVKTDAEGNITFNVDDACGNFNSGTYTFMFDGVEVNLCAGEPALVQSATVTPISIIGDETIATVVTTANATKIQLIENGSTRTYAKDNSNVTVTENEDGTLVWTIKFIERSIGERTILVKGKDAQGWQDTDFMLNTEIIDTPALAQEALKSVADASVMAGERANVKVKVAQGTQTIRFIFADNTTTTLDRKESYVVAEVDGIETWLVPVKAFGTAGDQSIDVIAKYNNKWERENVCTFTLTVNVKTVEAPTIYSAKAQKDKISSGEYVDVVVITNTVTTKLQFVLANGSTITYSESNAVISNNGDGTLIWRVKCKFTARGENTLTLKARSAKGWGEAESFGSVTVE